LGRNYEKELFQHLEETILKVDRLTDEITTLKKEHRKEIETLKADNQQLRKENQALRTENQKLKSIINKNSGNSSKPPSSDGFVRIQNSREKTGRKPGGQPGHKGHKPKLYEKPTEIVDIKQEKCPCGGQVTYNGEYTAKQLVDIELRTNITEYREHVGFCHCCGTRIATSAPVNDLITYGNNLKAFCCMLTTEGCVSVTRTQQIVNEFSSGMIHLSEGTIAKWACDLASQVAPSIEKIKENLLVSPVLNKDETGVHVGKSLHWFHVLSNKTHTLYFSHKKRGNDADKEMGVLPGYSGVLMHDHLRGLYAFTCNHAECNAHVLRYLKAAIEGKKRKWAENMIKLLLEAKAEVLVNGGNPPDSKVVGKIFRRYEKILEQGRAEFLQDELPDYNGEDMKLLRRLGEYKAEHLRFVSNTDVPFDNNQAERDLRMIKAKIKISGCFRADDGDEIFAAIKSYTSTLRKNCLNIFLGIKLAFAGEPILL